MIKKECNACSENFTYTDDVILVAGKIYHRDCVILYPNGFVAFLDDEFLGETENDDGSPACEYISDLLD